MLSAFGLAIVIMTIGLILILELVIPLSYLIYQYIEDRKERQGKKKAC
jgi:hypothetical protein